MSWDDTHNVDRFPQELRGGPDEQREYAEFLREQREADEAEAESWAERNGHDQ